MEKNLPDEALRCYVTWNANALPEYGADVIAVLIGEEWGLVPRYARHVRMVARALGWANPWIESIAEANARTSPLLARDT